MVTQPRLDRDICCLHGHRWTEASRLVDKRGVKHCRICNRISWDKSKARKKAGLGPVNHYAERNQPAPKPEREPIEAAKWHIYQLESWELGYTPEQVLRRLREWFIRRMAHCPSVLTCSKTTAAELREYIRGNRVLQSFGGRNGRWEDVAILEDETAVEGCFGVR
ncbi:MAG: hypothetical protein Q7O66_00790 [Dehalococcoidia bacterium]|nr:hypothetical protein [Dehalococcoidia bacterium]